MLTLGEETLYDPVADMIAKGRRVRDKSGWASLWKPEELSIMFNVQIRMLKYATGQDFGDDLEAYARWYEDHKEDWYTYSLHSEGPSGVRI